MSGAADHRAEWIKLRYEGMTLRQIAERFGVSQARVHQITGNMGPRGTASAAPDSGERPAWTVPGPELLRLAHEARDEIRANWR